MRYDNIIWDFDGTLFDTYPAMCGDLRKVMEGLGVQVTAEDLISRFTAGGRYWRGAASRRDCPPKR